MTDVCPRCNGASVVPRTPEEDGTEADPDIHPITARAPKMCPRCGGSGKATLTPEEIAARTPTS